MAKGERERKKRVNKGGKQRGGIHGVVTSQQRMLNKLQSPVAGQENIVVSIGLLP